MLYNSVQLSESSMHIILEHDLFLMFSLGQPSFTAAQSHHSSSTSCGKVNTIGCALAAWGALDHFVRRISKSCGLPPRKLKVEIQENFLITSYGFSVVSPPYPALSPWSPRVFYSAQCELCCINFSLGIFFSSGRYG